MATEGTVDEMLEGKVKDQDEVGEESGDDHSGPGYMGWAVNDEPEMMENQKDYGNKIAEIKEAYKEMKKEFEDMMMEFNKSKRI